MNLYLIEQSQNNDYDTFDSAVVAARTEEEARNIIPKHEEYHCDSRWGDTWASGPEYVTATLIGTTRKYKAGQQICASFNAG